MQVRCKLISASDVERFEERLNRFIDALANDDVIVDIKFSTAASGSGVEFSALVQYQETESWE